MGDGEEETVVGGEGVAGVTGETGERGGRVGENFCHSLKPFFGECDEGGKEGVRNVGIGRNRGTGEEGGVTDDLES